MLPTPVRAAEPRFAWHSVCFQPPANARPSLPGPLAPLNTGVCAHPRRHRRHHRPPHRQHELQRDQGLRRRRQRGPRDLFHLPHRSCFQRGGASEGCLLSGAGGQPEARDPAEDGQRPRHRHRCATAVVVRGGASSIGTVVCCAVLRQRSLDPESLPVAGFLSGPAMAAMYSTFALCLWYATELIRNGKMSGGTALTVRHPPACLPCAASAVLLCCLSSSWRPHARCSISSDTTTTVSVMGAAFSV